MAKYDWDAIRTDYIHGYINEEGNLHYPTYKELSQKHGPSEKTIRNKSSKDKWSQKKDISRTKIGQAIEEKRQEQITDEALNFDSENLETAKIGITDIKGQLSKGNIPVHDHLKFSNALVNYQKVGLNAMGQPTEYVKSEGRHDVNFNKGSQQRILTEEGYTG